MATDEELVQSVQAGNRQAFKELIDRYNAGLYAYCRSRLDSGAQAEELTQDAFVEAYLSLDRKRQGTDFAAWLRAICRNLLRNHYRRLSRRKEVSLIEACVDVESPEPLSRASLELLRACLERLDDFARRAVEGFYAESLPIAAIAASAGKSVSSVTVTLHRARHRLRECLKASGVEGLV